LNGPSRNRIDFQGHLQGEKVGPIEMLKNRVLECASRLRYPKLLALAFGLFLIDLVIPDFIPFIDEVLLGLLSLMLAGLKKRNKP
jgi:hypothetical protein